MKIIVPVSVRQAIVCISLIVAGYLGWQFGAEAQEATPLTCAAEGRSYEIGETACIPACHGQQQLARCEQSDSGVTWTSISTSCPNALNFSPRLNFSLAKFAPDADQFSEAISFPLN
ncbi:MAG: hypothetical protein ACR2O0_09595 [Rhizobiaceae bacterium]